MDDNSGHSFAAYFKRAVSPLMVLSLLRETPKYGYEISHEISLRSGDKLALSLLYPVLYRLEEQGYIRITDTSIENGRARNYYGITPEGAAYLDNAYAEFKTLAALFCGMVEGEKSNEK